MNLTVTVDQGVILLLGLKSSQGMGLVKIFVPCFDTPACERFDTYLYGRDVVHVKTDHQPLEANFKEDLSSALKRLQRMLLRLHRYNLNVKYQKRKLDGYILSSVPSLAHRPNTIRGI